MADFDVDALLKLSERNLAPELNGLSKAQVQALLEGERAKGAEARKGVIRLLQGEIDALAAQLSERSIETLARGVHTITTDDPPWDAMSAEQRGQAVDEVLAVLTDPAPDKDKVFVRAVLVMSAALNQVEALAAHVDYLAGARERQQVGPGSLAENDPPADGQAQAKLLEDVVALAFCEGSDVRFKIDAGPGDFVPGVGGKVAFDRAVELVRDKPPVRIDTVAALDAEGRPIARVRWPVALEGGGGRHAMFKARSISFDL